MMFGGGVGIYIRDKGDGYTRYATKLNEYGMVTWEHLDQEQLSVQRSPTLSLDEEVARAVTDALTRHFGGVTDQGLLIATLAREQDRGDRMLTALIDLATRPQLRKAEQ